MKILLVILLLAPIQMVFSQKAFQRLYNDSDFTWETDSTISGMRLYYTADSWTSTHLDQVRERVERHFKSTKQFLKIDAYAPVVHLFIVSSREQMKLLVGHETNGSAYYKDNTITGIASEKLKSVYSNHELFHILGMNIWGVPDVWINEGMGVYADNNWHGHDLYALAHYLQDHNRTVSLNHMIKNFRKADNRISYPLIGSFVKFLDDAYGREAVIKIWKGNRKSLTRITGKSIEMLEKEWIQKISEVEYIGITY